MHTREEKLEKFGKLLDVMDKLRSDCPWNHAQTIDSLRPMTLEEVYELSDAVLKKSDEDLKKELGDVMLHLVFYSKIAEEEGRYDIGDVLDKISEKMIFRHPHVFSEGSATDAKSVSDNWELMKMKEKGGNKRILSGVPDSMPSLLKSLAMQEKAAGVGFDWTETEGVWAKVKEELHELKYEMENDGSQEHKEEEFGDLLFSLVNVARHCGINPDTALSRTCEKFKRRFTYVEEQTLRKGMDLKQMTLEQLDSYWDEAKSSGL